MATYTTQEAARAASLSAPEITRLARAYGRGRKHGPVWLFDDEDLAFFRQPRPKGWRKGRPRGVR